MPAVYEVCETCGGKGKHVNPAIDGHGISAEEMHEDPDFAEDYFSGVYDVPCEECGGRGLRQGAGTRDQDGLLSDPCGGLHQEAPPR